MDQIRHIGLPDGRSFVHHHGTAGAGDISDEDDKIEQARDIVDAKTSGCRCGFDHLVETIVSEF
jgi:hypothetical protein